MTTQEKITSVARQLYMKLPFWKRYSFRKWYYSNNWDVKGIYESCLIEAEGLVKTEEMFLAERK